MRSVVTIVLALLANCVATYAFTNWLAGRRIVAVETYRSMHTGTVPTGGGWPLIAVAALVTILVWPGTTLLWVLLAGVAALALVSWIDDLGSLRPSLRLVIHATAAALLLMSLPSHALVFHGALPLVADRLVTGVGLVWFMNLYNFMDGIDGMAGTETITLALGYAVVMYAAGGSAGGYHGLAMAVIGATAGFLVWNWAPAKIFLGDVGSVPLGFLTGAMMIDVAIHASFAAAAILPLYYLTDATLTLVRRVLRGERPWQAHKEHAYQRAAGALGSHSKVVTRVAIANSVLLIAAVLAVTAPGPGIALAVATVAALMFSLERSARGPKPAPVGGRAS